MIKLKILCVLFISPLLIKTSFTQSNISCLQLSKLLNFEEILKNFRMYDSNHSLILIDKNKIASNECLNINWGNNILQITSDSLFSLKSIKGGSAALFNGQCQYFVIDSFKKKGNRFSFTIFQACSNEFIDCKVLKKGKKYILQRYVGGVY